MAHLLLAQCVLQCPGVKELWLVPSPQNPFKSPADLAPANDRLQMCRLATKGDEHIKVSDVELTLPQPSYTVNTLHRLRELHPRREFALLIGADNVAALPQWHEATDLFSGLTLLIVRRPGYNVDLDIPRRLGAKPLLVDAPLCDLSSTLIRQWIDLGRDIRHLVPDLVSDYIRQQHLYR